MSFEWELSKENVRPLKQGRNMDTLNAALGQQKPTLQRSLEAQRAEYEKHLSEEASESDDPVALYQNYVSWVEQAYPSGNRKALNEALEKSIRALVDMKDDVRCLKLWLKYIDLMGDASKQLPLFDHLQSSQYFQDQALFYEAWAALLESMQRHKDAENIYRRGLERKAAPLARLERHHKEFEQRVMAGVVLASKRPIADTTRASQPTRKALSDLGDQPGVGRSGSAIHGSAGVVNTRKVTPLTNARPTVLDENGQVACSQQSHSTSKHIGSGLSYSDKENVKAAGKWATNKVDAPHAIGFSDLKKGSSSVKVFGEPEAAVMPKSIGPETKNVVPASVLRPHKATAADSAGGLASISKPQPPREQPVYPKALVYTEYGEFSLEEIRARQALQMYAEEQVQSSDPDAMDLTRVIGQPIQVSIDRDTITRLTAKRELTITRRLSFDGLTPELSGRPNRAFDWNASGGSREMPTGLARPCAAPSSNSLNRSSSTITPSPAQNSSKNHFTATTPLPTGIVGERFPTVPANAPAVFAPSSNASALALLGGQSSSTQENQRPASAASADVSFAGRSSSMTFLGPAVTPTMTYHTRYATDRMMSAMKSNDLDNASLLVDSHQRSSVQQKAGVSAAAVAAIAVPAVAPAAAASTRIASVPTCSASTAFTSQPTEPGFTIFDETAPSEGIQIYDESAAAHPVDKENSGRVRKPRQNSGLRGLSQREVAQPAAAPASNEEGMDDGCDAAPPMAPCSLAHSTPGPASQNVAMGHPALSTIRQPHRVNSGDCDESSTATWPNTKKLSPIEEELSRTGSSLSRSSSTGSNRSGMCSTIASVQHDTIAEEEPMDEPVSIPADPSASTCFPDETVINGLYVGDPFSPGKRAKWMQHIGSDLSDHPGYKDLSTKPLPEVSEKLLGKAVILDEDDERSVFVLKDLLGTGAFSTVFSANHVAQDFAKDKEDIVALKVSETEIPDMWEFFLASHLPQRITNAGHADAAGYFINVKQCFHYANGTCMVLNRFKCTLLDVVNMYKSRHQTMPEALVLYYTWHMLHAVEALHAAGYLHADIKPDNFVISNDLFILAKFLQDSSANLVSSKLSELNRVKPLHLIDYGRAIDMSCLPASTSFNATVDTDDFACVEMIESRPWTQQIDTFGVLGTIHVLLNGDYMKVVKKNSASNPWQPTVRPKRYWNPIWNKLYSQLLNVPSCFEQPDLAPLREGVGKALEANAPKLYQALLVQHEILSV
ncbi:mitotic checkpoint serine/threonine-protein kinase BUB1-like [Sycon ciliatum]|uniref:mitotic checkpoint serine/threonine-protein kinase BUB1-like n=1 Tax=Sycon ciliatum TaxID=27933 RepID=UPI0031F6EAFB